MDWLLNYAVGLEYQDQGRANGAGCCHSARKPPDCELLAACSGEVQCGCPYTAEEAKTRRQEHVTRAASIHR